MKFEICGIRILHLLFDSPTLILHRKYAPLICKVTIVIHKRRLSIYGSCFSVILSLQMYSKLEYLINNTKACTFNGINLKSLDKY